MPPPPPHLTLTLTPGSVAAAGILPAYDYYVDAVDGNDSNDGRSPATAFATITQVLSATSGNRAASVGLRRGQRHIPPTSMTFGVTGRWGGYGEGHLPFIDCSRAVTMGDIVPHGTHANVYVVEITHAQAPFYTNNVASNGPHVGLWWETTATGILGQYLTPVFGSANTATAEQFVKDNPGRCFVQKVGSTNTDVRTETSGSTLRYTFQLANSGDPRSGGTLRYACHHATNISYNPGAKIIGIAFGRNTRKDLCNCATNAASPSVALPEYTGCVFLDPGCHANVGPSNWTKCYAISRTLSLTNGGGGYHNYTDVFEPRVPVIEDSYVAGFTHAIYSHGVAQSPVIQSMQGRRLKIENCGTSFSLPAFTQAALFEDVDLRTTGTIVSGHATIRRMTAGLTLRSNASAVYNFGPCGAIEDAVISYDGTGGNRTVNLFTGGTQAGAIALGTPTLRRVTFAVRPEHMTLNDSTRQYITYVIDSCAGIRTNFENSTTATTFPAAATVSNSYFGPVKNANLPTFATLGDMQAKIPGVSNDVIMYDGTKPVTFAGDPLVDPTITGPAEILNKGMGVDPAIIQALPATLANVPTLQSAGFAP